MNMLRSAAMAFACFSKIPMPHVEWREENMRFMIGFFPAVGIAIGLLLAAWAWFARVLGLGAVLYGAGLALIPLAVTGGIHLDGFCDVVDAQSSHAEPQRKRDILKDPHIGAFAAIGVGAYLIAYTACASEIEPIWPAVLLLAGMHVTSRCMSGFATKIYPLSASKGMLSMERGGDADRAPIVMLVVTYAVAAAFMIGVSMPAGIAMLAVGLACLVALRPFADSQFGGMSGDLAGFFLQVAELGMLSALVVVVKVVGL